MKKIIIVILACLSVVACKEANKTEGESNILVTEDIQLSQGGIVTTDSIESTDIINDDLYPKNEDLPLFILSTGVFHGDEMSPEMINKGWFGVFHDRGRYYIASTTLNVKKAFDVVLDEEREEHNPSKWTGWEVKTSHIDTSLVLISSTPSLSSHEIKAVPLEKGFVDPNEKMTFVYNGASYALYSTADVKPDEYNKEDMSILNYKLYLKGYKNGKEINQLLASTSSFEDAIFEIFFIGDIDNDGFPDLILNTSNHYNIYRPTVYLSSFSESSQLVKVVGLHESVGC